MKPSERLNEIEEKLELMDVHDLEHNINWLINRVRTLEVALEFYGNMDNRVPGTSEWDVDILTFLGRIPNVKVTSFNKPSKIDTDVGAIARKVLEQE